MRSTLLSTSGLHAGPTAFHQRRSCSWMPPRLLPEGDDHGAGDGGDAAAAAAKSAADLAAARKGAGDGKAGAGSGGGDHKPFSQMSSEEKAAHYGYPFGVPPKDMNDKQQAAYYRAQAEKHEARTKALGITPEDLRTLQEKAARSDALEYELGSDKDKAVNDAKKTAQAEADTKWGQKLAATEVRAQLRGKGITDPDAVAEIMSGLNLASFMNAKGDDVDPEKVESHLKHYGPAKGTRPAGPSASGQGFRSTAPGTPGDQGRAQATKRFGIKADA